MTTSPADLDPDLSLRPYIVAGGRTHLPTDWSSVGHVEATDTVPPGLEPEYEEILGLCPVAMAVVEVCARSSQPTVVAALLLNDLISIGAVRVRGPIDFTDNADNKALLERVLIGLRSI